MSSNINIMISEQKLLTLIITRLDLILFFNLQEKWSFFATLVLMLYIMVL